MKSGGRNFAFIIVFGGLGLTQFSENVRTVQVIGLFASGAVVGAALYGLFAMRKGKPTTE